MSHQLVTSFCTKKKLETCCASFRTKLFSLFLSIVLHSSSSLQLFSSFFLHTFYFSLLLVYFLCFCILITSTRSRTFFSSSSLRLIKITFFKIVRSNHSNPFCFWAFVFSMCLLSNCYFIDCTERSFIPLIR